MCRYQLGVNNSQALPSDVEAVDIDATRDLTCHMDNV